MTTDRDANLWCRDNDPGRMGVLNHQGVFLMNPFTDAILAPYPPSFRAAIQFIMGPSNDGHADDSAPGEAFVTRWGITAMTWDYAASHGIVTGTLADATLQQIVAIYSALFWRAAGCYRLEPSVGFMVFNDAV